MNKNKERLLWFDIVRGFCLFLALLQHYSFYLNYWFVHFFKETELLDSFYKIYDPLMGKQLPVDSILYWLAFIFTPVVSQIFLTLASFNLSKYSESHFKLVFSKKIALFLVLLGLFVFENFIVSDSLGESISLYPLMTWMIILSVISIVFRFAGFKGILILQILSFGYLIEPEVLNPLELLIKNTIHPDFNLDANPLFFLPSACMGFILGHIYFHKQDKSYRFGLIALGIGLFIIGYLLSPEFQVNRLDVLETEHLKSYDFFGVLEFLGIQIVIIQLCLWFNKNKPNRLFNILSWIGKKSLIIFFFHRIFFVFIYMPILLRIGAYLNWDIRATVYYTIPAIILEMLFCYFVLKTKVLVYLGKE